jgi:hypothetical protein
MTLSGKMGGMKRALYGLMWVSMAAMAHHDGQDHFGTEACSSVRACLSPHRFLKTCCSLSNKLSEELQDWIFRDDRQVDTKNPST